MNRVRWSTVAAIAALLMIGALGLAGCGGPASEPSASGLPVMYEFYTDW